MSWKLNRKAVAIALSAIAIGLLAPSAYHLYSFSPTNPDGLVCYPEFNPLYTEDNYEAQYVLQEQKLIENLANSENPDDQAMYLLARNNGRVDEADIPVWSQLAQQYPDSGFVAAEFINSCAKNTAHTACDDIRLAAMADRHGNNAAMWGSLALVRAAREDSFGTVSALRRAAAAPEFDDYFSLQTRLLDAATPADEPLAKVGTAFRIFRFVDPGIGVFGAQSLSMFCLEQSASDPLARQYCLEYGERVAAGSSNLLGQHIGLAIQEVTYQAIGDLEGQARIEEATNALSEYQRRYSGPFIGLMSYDESLADFWVENLIENGEVATLELVYNEVQLRTANEDYKPCDPPGLRFDFPYFYFGDERVVW